jgi:hypothetical protein
LTKPNTFQRNREASVATRRWCSGSSRNAVRPGDIRALGDFLGDLLQRSRPEQVKDAIALIDRACAQVFTDARRVEDVLRVLSGEIIWDQLGEG